MVTEKFLVSSSKTSSTCESCLPFLTGTYQMVSMGSSPCPVPLKYISATLCEIKKIQVIRSIRSD